MCFCSAALVGGGKGRDPLVPLAAAGFPFFGTRLPAGARRGTALQPSTDSKMQAQGMRRWIFGLG